MERAGTTGNCLADHAFDLCEGSDIEVTDPEILAALQAISTAVALDGGTESRRTESGDANLGLLIVATSFAGNGDLTKDALGGLYGSACAYVQKYNPDVFGGTAEKNSACKQLIVAIEGFLKNA